MHLSQKKRGKPDLSPKFFFDTFPAKKVGISLSLLARDNLYDELEEDLQGYYSKIKM